MFFIFKILIALFLCITSSIAKEVVFVEGLYSYGPSISQNEACDRAIMNGKTFFNSSFIYETGKVAIKNSLIKNRKTERVGNNFVTFTKIYFFYR